MLQLIKCNKQASKLQDKLDETGSRVSDIHRDRERWKDHRERERSQIEAAKWLHRSDNFVCNRSNLNIKVISLTLAS